ncbi:DNA-binding transcriptional LysR family regulator [Desulfomicrobium macestii]|uniref:DNA-binding transcriptional LysR family regulator n=1 Tax=Desulfomicrobium macestii TaxID=90731 RepID=A0ABR9H9T3_9BACT|nr:LysR family transcriptional regulator [Desulfomicrobium macestii]MBE1427318.1 DNA-binding transcriptional LysR family regulator [Desulfomicrobium macestii]
MTERMLESLDMRQLRYFAVVAEELNLRRAAERLFMAQPPLSRHMKRLEEFLGVALFVRHSRGLTLTTEGERVLEIVRPVLELETATRERLHALRVAGARAPVVGLTTAFEQGVFAALESRLFATHGPGLRLERATSPRLVRDVRRGKVDAAFVALPLDAPGLHVVPLSYAEPLLAVLPEGWPEATQGRHRLRDLSGKPLFWFRREGHPAFFDHTKQVFAHAGFAPMLKEEPAEHDVLLARIAAGEGMGLFPASFSAIRRTGVVFAALAEGNLLGIRLGLITRTDLEALAESLVRLAEDALTSAKNLSAP